MKTAAERTVLAHALFSSRNAPRPAPTVCDACDIFAKYPKGKQGGVAPNLLQIARPREQERM